MSNATGEDRPPFTRSPPTGRLEQDDRAHPLDGLLAGLEQKCPETYNRLYGLVADRLLRVAIRLVDDRETAEDAVRETFLKLVRTTGPSTEGRSLETWLFRQIIAACGDQASERQRIEPHERWLNFDPEVEAALAILTRRQWLIVHFRHVENFDDRQIAAILGTKRFIIQRQGEQAERRLSKILSFGPTDPTAEADHG